MLGDAVQLHALHNVHQRDDRARRARTAGAPGAVDVAFMVFGRLKKKNVRKLGDVDAARGYVCGHQVLQATLADFFQHFFAPCLGKVGRKLVGIVAKALQHAGHIVHVGLGIAKNKS